MSLVEDGRPMAALRALAEFSVPVNASSVMVRAARDDGEAGESAVWGDALRSLADRGLAIQSGEAGAYRYAISEAGQRELFGEGSGQAPPEET